MLCCSSCSASLFPQIAAGQANKLEQVELHFALISSLFDSSFNTEQAKQVELHFISGLLVSVNREARTVVSGKCGAVKQFVFSDSLFWHGFEEMVN